MHKTRNWFKSLMNKVTSNKKDLVILMLIMLLAFVLRAALMKGKVFASSDEVHYLFSALDTQTIFHSHGVLELLINIYRLFNFPWGPINPIYNSVYLLVYGLFNIPMTEFTLTLPYIILGTLCVPLVYIISADFFSKETAVLASLLVAINPLFIQTSRETAATGLMDAFLLMLLFIVLSRHLSTAALNRNGWALLVGFVIAANTLADSQFLAIFPFILAMTLYYFFIASRKFSFRGFLSFIKKKYLNAYLLLPPAIIFSFLVAVWLYPGIMRMDFLNTTIGHFFLRGGGMFSPGFHVLDFILYLSLTSGWAITLLAPFSVIYGFYLLKNKSREGFLIIWFAIYSFPWLVLIKAPEMYRDFFHLWLIPLIILASAVSCRAFEWVGLKLNKVKSLTIISLSLILICAVTLLTSFSAVFDMGPFNEPAYYGTVSENTGIKSAGYYFRSNFGGDTQLLSEFGMPVIKYYFNVNPIGNSTYLWTYSWPDIGRKYSDIKKDTEKADVLVLDYNNYNRFFQNSSSIPFYTVAIVYSGNIPKIIILSKEYKDYTRLDTEFYDARFDDEYGNWESLYIKDYYK